jgi:hypothetical protein
VYLGYVIGEEELKIDPTKMDSILKWPNPTNVLRLEYFWGNTIPTKFYSILFNCGYITPFHNSEWVKISSEERIIKNILKR